ncbi:hypothetical protein Z042_02575 [Chania multitudinisentens RB-25]|uniref:Uncharacterized protein n=1 Tax=Chania multitudinisentens RB-25 TaxID=1441930 RepID=W0LFW1_9GAMM|nr:contractile injection system tape measure protein [Chania multitudinisentens]AHG22616.2 hypothetical protein Z042_02575 [Chania multitudinisentens RB-25]
MVNPGLYDSGFIGKVTIVIEVSDCDGNKVIEKCLYLFEKKIISKKLQELILNLNTDLSLSRIVLDVGVIEYNLFEIQMVDKLTSTLEKALSIYYGTIPKSPLGKTGSYQTRRYERPLMENRISDPSVQPVADIPHETTTTGEPSLMAAVEHYLQQGVWSTLSNNIPRLNNKESPFNTQDLWLQIQRQPQQWLPMLAKHCLQPLGRRRLAVILTQAEQKALCCLLTENNLGSSIAIAEQLNHVSMVASAHLTTAAEHYFKKPVTIPKGSKPPAWSVAKTTIQPVGRDRMPKLGYTLPVSNAGSLIFWPLLPTLFNIFSLLEKQVFINQQTQVDAVCLLDWLVWGDDDISDERLPLNKVICGLPVHFEAAWCAPEAEKKVLINEWLGKTLKQFPEWEKMGSADIRKLFLQRSGEINWGEVGIAIHVTPEAYDALIYNWPWPMNMVCFNWLQQPLTIRWL